jgi:peroxiredoxin
MIRSVRGPIAPILALLALLATFEAAQAAPPQSSGNSKGVEVGQRVPEFSLATLDGSQVSYEKQIRGKAPVTLLFFMTTACSACYEELKEINDFLGKNQGRIDAWCVAGDLRGTQTVIPFAKANSFRVRYLVDPRFSLPRVFGFNYTPSLAVIDARGILLYKKGGYNPSEKVTDLIRSYVK